MKVHYPKLYNMAHLLALYFYCFQRILQLFLFKCTKCRKIFMSGRYLRAHVKNIHEEGQKAICDVCGE